MARNLDIGEVVRQSGLPASALRFYEERGLIHSVGRKGLRRLFEADVVERLALIVLGQSAGFALEEMLKMFSSGRLKIDRHLLATKAAELDSKVRKLSAMRDGLRHAAECPAPSHLECPTFRKLMKRAIRIPGASRTLRRTSIAKRGLVRRSSAPAPIGKVR